MAKKKPLPIKIFLAVLIPIILIFAVFFALTKEKPNKIGNRSHNILSGGLVAQQGHWIYYVGDDGIYKTRTKGGGSEKIVDGDYYRGLNVIGDYIYCQEGGEKIYKIGIKDKSITNLLENKISTLEDESGLMLYNTIEAVTDKEIYFTLFAYESQSLYRMDLKDGRINKIMDGYYPVVHVDEKYIYCYRVEKDLYIIDDLENNFPIEYSIYRLNRDGSDAKVLFSDSTKGITKVSTDNNYLYLLEGESQLYQYNLLNGEKKLVFENEQIVDIAVEDGWIYYVIKDGLQINRMKIGGNKTEKITEEKAPYGFYLFDHHIVYQINDKNDFVIVKLNGSEKVTTKNSEQ